MRNRGFTVIIGSLSIAWVRKTEKLRQQVGGFCGKWGCRTRNTKSERDSAVLGGLVWGEGRCYNPSGSRSNSFGRQHLTFDKGGKGVGGFRGIVRFLKRLWEWKGSVQQSLKVCDGLHCNRKNRVLCRTRFFLTVDILFRRYPLAVLLYCKVKMRCQL